MDEKKPPSNKDQLIVGSVFIVLLWGGYYLITGGESPASPQADSSGVSIGAAQVTCELAIKRLSLDPETAEVPFVNGADISGEFSFSWGASTKNIRMRNGLGLDVPASASCSVNKQTGMITFLTLNGETII